MARELVKVAFTALSYGVVVNGVVVAHIVQERSDDGRSVTWQCKAAKSGKVLSKDHATYKGARTFAELNIDAVISANQRKASGNGRGRQRKTADAQATPKPDAATAQAA